MPKTTTSRRPGYARDYERALVAAAEYRRLVEAGDYPRADEVERTIDALVGYRTTKGTWAWPLPVRRIAHGK